MPTLIFQMSAQDYMVLTVITLWLLVLLWFKRDNLKLKRSQKILTSEYKTKLRDDGIKITLSFDDYTVNEKRRYATVRAKDYYSDSLKSAMYNSYDEIEVEYIDSIIEANVEIDGLVYTFECSVPLDKDNLLIKLYMQKEINVYYDPDTEGYFFDLHFLD
ncbi:hypothetical protein [Flavobacterium beibuense]|uniref:hypothetical protein n=1 Tax=Flavobacterium beibuense TaxID=657326 RepID=UPI003A954BDF